MPVTGIKPPKLIWMPTAYHPEFYPALGPKVPILVWAKCEVCVVSVSADARVALRKEPDMADAQTTRHAECAALRLAIVSPSARRSDG